MNPHNWTLRTRLIAVTVALVAATSVVEIYISYLRRKIDAGRKPMIHTVRGAGYMLKAAD